MSYCELVVFRNNLAEQDATFSNAHGCTAFVWDRLCDKYHIRSPNEYVLDAWPVLWEAAKTLDLEHWERFVLLFTYDYALTRVEHLNDLADAMDKFDSTYNTGKYVCHLKDIANRLRVLSEDPTIQGVGLYGMSCSENLWAVYDEALGECVPYDLTKWDKHWWTTTPTTGVSNES